MTLCSHPAVYVGGYGNPKAAYAANPYNAGYNINQVCLLFFVSAIPICIFFHPHFLLLLKPHPQANTADSGSQFGPGSTHAPWGAYDMQRATGRR